MVETEPQRGVEVFGRADALGDREARLVDELADDPAEDQARSVAGRALDVLAELGEVTPGRGEVAG
jgi:hypothetical protein